MARTTTDTSIIFRDNRYFPERLCHIPDPPKLLYCRGNVELLTRSAIAVVGTRKMTRYGAQVTDAVVQELVRAGLVVVSGLAFGVDARAHASTLDARGATIAVLGSGIDTITPTTNERLGQRILESGGLIVSEYPGTTPADKWTFPNRNRIISGLSLGVVVIEADHKSGSLITAKHALEQGRDVFAVPGSIFAASSSGTNYLVAQGARPVLAASDITQEYLEQGLIHSPGHAQLPTFDDPVASAIFAILTTSGPHHIDTLVRETKFDVARISGTLSVLELRGTVASDGRGTWMIKK